MAQQSDNLEKVRQTLIKSGYNPPSSEQFHKDMQNEDNLRRVHQTLIDNGYEPPVYDDFRRDMGVMSYEERKTEQSPSSEQGFVISQSQLDQEEPGAVESNREVSSPAKPTKLPNPNFMGIAEQGRRGVQQALNAVKFQQANRGFDVKPVKLGENRHVVEQTNLNPQTGKFEKSYITESGNEYSEEEKAFANLEQGNIDEYKFSQSVEGQLRSAYDELERLKEEYNKAIQDAGKYQQIDMQGNILGISDEDAYIKASQRASNIKSAIQLTERRIASMEEVRKRRGAEEYNAKEKVKDFERGFWDLTTDPDTWLFGLPGLNTSIKLTQAFNKAKNGEELAESMYGDENGRFYRYGNITAQALPFVVEFLTTKGGFRALSESISGAVEKGLASNIENAAARWMVKNTGVLAGDMARAVAMANSTGAAKTASDILSRHLGQIGKDGNGNYYAQDAKDLWRSIYEGEMAQVFEYFTEMLGNHMNMGKWLAKGANKINLKKLSKAITYLTKNDFLNYVGVQDFPSEVMEEEVNLVLNALFVGDNNFSTGPLKELANKWFGKDYKVNKDSDEYRESIFNPQTQGDIIGGMFYSIGLMKAPKFLMDAPGLAQHAYNFAQYKRYEHNVDAADKVASFRFTPENWEPLREQINNATNDQMGGVINSILQDKDLSTQEKQAAMDYVGNLLKMRGFNTALMTYQKNQARDGQEPDVQEKVGQEIAKSEMEGYEAREPEEMQDVQNLMTIKREALEEVAEPGLVASLDENPVEALRNLYDEYSNSEDVSNILNLATDYVNARMRYNGMVNRISDDIDSNIQVAHAQIDSNVDQHTNQIRPAILKQGERPVYIVDDTNQSDDASIIVKDAETGKVEFVSPRDIASIGEALDPEQEKLRVETEVRNQIAQQEIDKANGTLPMAVNDVYDLIDEEGKPHLVQIVADNGDGTVQAVVDGKPNEAFPKQVIQDMADLKNRARAQELANAGSSDIEPMSSDGSPMPSQEEANGNELNEETNGGITNTSEIEVRSPMPMKGEEPDFISVTPERSYQFLSEESQWSPEEVSEFVSNNQKAAQQALAKAQEKKPKMGTSFAKFNADKAVYADNVAKAQQVADYWDAVANLDAVNKQRRNEEAQRQLWSTPEGREQSLANAKNEREKQALAKQIYGSYLNDDFYFPDTIEELVSMQLPYNGLAWESYTIGTKPIRGLKEELGSNKRRGVGRQFDTNAFNSYLAKNGEGRSVDNMTEMMYMSPENLPDGENPRWEVQEIRDAILDMLMSASKSTDIKDYVLNSRIENAERSMRAEEDQIAMDRAEYARSMNIAPEELDLLEEYLKAEIPRLAEAYEEFYRNFVPEETETQDSNGTEQIAGSASVDSESAEGGSNELVASSEGEVRGTARGEEAGAVDNEPSGTDGEAEGDTSGQPVPDNDVPEGERITLQEQIAEAEAETDTNPTEAQKEAGNYKKGHVNIDGFDVTIENPKGSVRSGVDAGGKAWSQTMNNTYGYIRGTEGVDGDHIDVFLSDNPSQGDVYVIDQVNKDGSFDEHKVMYGFGSEQEARDAYLSNYEEGWQGLGNITHVSKEEFKKWVDSSHRKTKPFAEYKSVEKLDEEPSLSKVEGKAQPATKEERTMRDVIAELLRSMGINVIADEKAGQEVLDWAGDMARLMGTKKSASETAAAQSSEEEQANATDISSADGAKLLKDIDTLAKKYEEKSNRPYKFLDDVSDVLGATSHGTSSKYLTIIAKNGSEITIRLANHNAAVSNFDNNGEADGVSIVVSKHPNEGITDNGNAHIVEYFYSEKDLRKAKGKPLVSIIRSIEQMLYSGEYKDTTGLAKSQEVNPKYFRTSDGEVYGFALGGKIYLDPRIANTETPIHEYAHLWAQTLRQANPEEWNNIVELMKGTPVWESVKNEYPELETDDEIAEEVLAHYSGSRGAERLREEMRNITEGNGGVFEKAEAITALDRVRQALNSFWKQVADFLHIHYESAEQVADQVLKDLLNGVMPVADYDTTIKASKVTDKQLIKQLEEGEKEIGYRNVVQNPDGTLGSPMANKLGKKGVGRKATSPFEFGNWEQADENPELATDDGKIDLIKPDGKTVDSVDYNPYIHIRPTLVNKQFKQAWERPNLVYVRTQYPVSELTSGYHAEKAKLSVGKHPWNGGELILSRYDKPIEIVPWEEVADDWMEEFGDKEINFDIIPPKLLPILTERGANIVEPHKGMGENCKAAYEEWKKENEIESNLTPKQQEQVHTEAFKEYFGDWENDPANASKIVDENGEPMVVYHGDKAKGRYVFTPNTFFTGKEDYAGRYTRGTGEVGAYFLNIRKPFDIRDEEARKIFTEYRNGHEPSQTASGAMDWADYDYDDLQEYLEENYPDKYDGFILDEGGDGGYGNEVAARGLSYIPYYPEQIKSATDNSGAFSPQNKDVRFREGEEKTLAGFHNISSDKLKKALKQGGLANPSMAVINTEDRAHTDYGDISLIAPSRLIDARTGKNVGTYAGDAWTPTYPGVTLFLTAKGEKHRQAIAKENADGNKELENHLLHGLADYIDDSADRLHFLFLKQKGLNPEIATERITHSHEEYEAVQKILGDDASTLSSDFTKEQSDALLDLMMSEYEKQVRKDAEKIKDEAKRESAVEAMLTAKRQSLTDENGKLWFAKGDTYVNSVWRDEQRRNNPKPDWYRTDNDASYRVAKEGLSEEYQKWKEQLFNDEDIEEKIFTGYTSDGRRKYIPNTLENVSRLMNKEQNTQRNVR